jgi:hypothetical protein
VARVATAGAVASETFVRASLDAARQSAEDQAISAETTAATAVTERDSLASRLALAEVEIKKLRVAAASAEEADERAKTAVATAETTAREASQTAVREKAALEAKVLELESDLQTATTGLATTSHQLSQVTNQLQAATEEASRFQDSYAKLSQDLEGKSDDPPVLVRFCVCFLSELDLVTMVAGSRVIRAGMVAQLATVKQEWNAAVLKVIEKDSVLKCLSEQLQSTFCTWVLSPCSFFPLESSMTSCLRLFFRGLDRVGAVPGISRAGRVRPEPGPRGPTQVGNHCREGHWGHRQAWSGDELGYGHARCISWSADARDADRGGWPPSQRGTRARVVDGSPRGTPNPRHD